MEDGLPLVIFHIARGNGASLFLHPMNDPHRMLELLEQGAVKGVYGREPQLAALHGFRDELYSCLDNAVARWALERSFIPRFVTAAAAFVLSYFVLSFLLRGAVPIAVHLVGAVLAGVATHQALARRRLAAESTVQKRETLREQLDRIVFSEHDFVYRLEEHLHHLESLSPEAVVDGLLAQHGELVRDHEYELAEQLVRLLALRFSGSGYRRKARKLVRLAADSGGTREVSRREVTAIKSWAVNATGDIALFGLLVSVQAALRQCNRSPAN